MNDISFVFMIRFRLYSSVLCFTLLLPIAFKLKVLSVLVLFKLFSSMVVRLSVVFAYWVVICFQIKSRMRKVEIDKMGKLEGIVNDKILLMSFR